MPESQRKMAARTRSQYTGEKFTAAKAGTARDHSIGLDACVPGQLKLRALLALGFLNRGYDYSTPAGWHMAALSAYTITASPRFDRMVLITDVPHNVVDYLLPEPNGVGGLPGLRVEEHRGYGTYVMQHLPTNAQFVVTDNPSGKPAGARSESYVDFFTVDAPLTPGEREQLAIVPPMTEHAQRLLAGVFCRISARDPHRRWAIGNWFYDPLRRSGWLDSGRSLGEGRKLQGAGDNWELRWDSYPYPDDLAASMTDPIIGIPEARTVSASDHLAITLGNATLRLRSRRA
ncbi:hypothetical protein DY245_03030 [Streptomyces inhibens]|uniref:Uncharacterized protein n=1 Tax=Streptomyces inhibens TaxID=2293571 RepID=A0A371QAG6_STRIH|nr:hypothetical protein [Streptomyces inhibens]REK91700.1 hypothetical protein DY245_03030 [Streptomyces inhibens]